MKKIKFLFPVLLMFFLAFSVSASEEEEAEDPDSYGIACSFNTTCGSDVCVTENAKNKMTNAGCVKQCDHICFMQKML